MIPQRIAIKGFLSYDGQREEQLSFEDGSLWLHTGPNGSGKSAVFDAMTFCLFGATRMGGRDYDDLINKQSEAAAVQFDFKLDGKEYRIHRSLERKKGKVKVGQEVSQFLPATQTWEVVPDASDRQGFTRWIEQNVGLSYETFTASVLLEQGKAEALLTAKPADRHEVLARIVGMDRYEQLHDRAVAQKNALKARADDLQTRLDGQVEVTDLDLAAAQAVIDQAESILHQNQEATARLQGLEGQARQWSEWQAALAKLEQQVQRAQGLLDRQAQIEADWQTLVELRGVLPALKRAVDYRERQRLATAEIARVEEARAGGAEQREALAQASDANARQRDQAEKALAGHEKRQKERSAELVSLTLALPLLKTIHQQREALRQAQAAVRTSADDERKSKAAAVKHQQELDQLLAQLRDAGQQREEAALSMTRLATLHEETRKRLTRLTAVEGKKDCPTCGQPLTPAHIKKEQVRLKKEVAGAEEQVQAAEKELKSRRKVEATLGEQHKALLAVASQAHQEMVKAQRQQNDAARDAERAGKSCTDAYGNLEDAFRTRLSPTPPADWLATVYPATADLAQLQEYQAKARTEATALDQEIKTHQGKLAKCRQQEKDLAAQQQDLDRGLAEHDQLLATQRAIAAASAEGLAAALADLPAAWSERAATAGAAQVREWEVQRDRLQQGGVEALQAEVQRSRLALDELVRQKEEIVQQSAAVPAEAQVAPEVLHRRLMDAGKLVKEATAQLVKANGEHQRLRDRRQARLELAEERTAAVQERDLYELLARYLGRDYLQRHLMEKAEDYIVTLAASILTSLSDGQLNLRRRVERDSDKAGAEKALMLEVENAATAGRAPLPVEMLSGSERFRVAVSLALAIGQFASRQHRPIQSVIIDEGFGCLDPANTELMIKELHNLQSQLSRILLVSHQEEFAQAFPNGYRFRLENGTTRVRRYRPGIDADEADVIASAAE